MIDEPQRPKSTHDLAAGAAHSLDEADLSEFDMYVRKWAEDTSRSPSPPLFNRTPARAAIVFKWLIRSAQNSIKLLTGGMNPEVYGREDLIEALHLFLDKSQARVAILFDCRGTSRTGEIDRDYVASHPALRAAVADPVFRSKLDVRIVLPQTAETYRYHFMVVDECSFRFEMDRASFEATAQFRNAEIARELSARFDDLQKKSRQVQL
jgi:hypothetical protein